MKKCGMKMKKMADGGMVRRPKVVDRSGNLVEDTSTEAGDSNSLGQVNPVAPVPSSLPTPTPETEGWIQKIFGNKKSQGMAGGGKVPGHAAVKGDSKRNDKVHALLSPGEIVVPRSAAKSAAKASRFVKKIVKRK